MVKVQFLALLLRKIVKKIGVNCFSNNLDSLTSLGGINFRLTLIFLADSWIELNLV